jgi:hypothetical protein
MDKKHKSALCWEFFYFKENDVLSHCCPSAKNVQKRKFGGLETELLLHFNLEPKLQNSSEVIIHESKLISLGIVTKTLKYSSAERRLKTVGDFKPIHLLNLDR